MSPLLLLGDAADVVRQDAGGLKAGGPGLKRLHHTARGYTYLDPLVSIRHQHTAVPGETCRVGVSARRVDQGTALVAYVTQEPVVVLIPGVLAADGPALVIGKLVDGELTVLEVDQITPLVASSDYWVTLHVSGNLLTAGHWTDRPTLGGVGAPITTLTHTLTGGDETLFGEAAGYAGIFWQPGPTFADQTLDEFTIQPYTFRAVQTPEVLELADIPGSAPAKIDVHLAPTTPLTATQWGLLAWQPEAPAPAAGSLRPFGVLDSADAASITGGTTVVIAGARGGTMIAISTAAAGSATIKFDLDSAALGLPAFSTGDIDVELYLAGALDQAVTGARLSATIGPKNLPGPVTGPREQYGSTGRPLARTSGWRRRAWRIGTLTLRREPGQPGAEHELTLTFTWPDASADFIHADYIVLAPVHARAGSPTGKVRDSSYPVLIPAWAFASAEKIIRHDLSGQLHTHAEAALDAGLGGEPITAEPGDTDVLVWLAKGAVPDDPTASSTDDHDDIIAGVHFAVTPRVRLMSNA